MAKCQHFYDSIQMYKCFATREKKSILFHIIRVVNIHINTKLSLFFPPNAIILIRTSAQTAFNVSKETRASLHKIHTSFTCLLETSTK